MPSLSQSELARHRIDTAVDLLASATSPEELREARRQVDQLRRMSDDDLRDVLGEHQQYARESSPVMYAMERAPTGGIDFGGKRYHGGQFIPAAAIADATPAEKEELHERQEEEAEADEPASTADAGEELAKEYAEFFNNIEALGLEVPEEQVQTAGEELSGTGWLVDHDEQGEEWVAIPDERETRYYRSGRPIIYAAARSPKGGVTISGTFYPGGRWIPGKVVAEAPPEEKAKIDSRKAEVEAGTQAKKSARVKSLRSRGSISLDTLRGDLQQASGGVEVDPNDRRAAAAAWTLFRRHHGELAVHRVEELAGLAKKALGRVAGSEHPNAEGLEKYWKKQLAKYAVMLDLAQRQGVSGEVVGEPEQEVVPPVTPTREDTGLEADKLPHQVRFSLEHAIGRLRGLAEALESGRQTDKQFRGEGRYEEDARRNYGEVSKAHDIISKFRDLARGHNVDADKVLAELGLPDETSLKPSAQSDEWRDPPKAPAPPIQPESLSEDDPKNYLIPGAKPVVTDKWHEFNLRSAEESVRDLRERMLGYEHAISQWDSGEERYRERYTEEQIKKWRKALPGVIRDFAKEEGKRLSLARAFEKDPSKHEEAIMELTEDAGRNGVHPEEVAGKVGLTTAQAESLLRRLARDGELFAHKSPHGSIYTFDKNPPSKKRLQEIIGVEQHSRSPLSLRYSRAASLARESGDLASYRIYSRAAQEN